MKRAGRLAMPLLAGLLSVAVIAAPTSGLGVGDGVGAFQIVAATGEKAGQQFCMV